MDRHVCGIFEPRRVEPPLQVYLLDSLQQVISKVLNPRNIAYTLDGCKNFLWLTIFNALDWGNGLLFNSWILIMSADGE